jgi:hypothetical protein
MIPALLGRSNGIMISRAQFPISSITPTAASLGNCGKPPASPKDVTPFSEFIWADILRAKGRAIAGHHGAQSELCQALDAELRCVNRRSHLSWCRH